MFLYVDKYVKSDIGFVFMVERAWLRKTSHWNDTHGPWKFFKIRQYPNKGLILPNRYGELEELTIFTQVVDRYIYYTLCGFTFFVFVCIWLWNICLDGTLLCFEALDMITMEISMKVCKSHGWNPTDSLRKSVNYHSKQGHVYKLFITDAQSVQTLLKFRLVSQ